MDCKLRLTAFSALVFHTVTILYSCTGHSELICSPQPITALAGDDVILPCCLASAISASFGRVEWIKPGLDPEYIHVHHDGRLEYESQNPSYYYRTRLFVDELINGNVSLKLFKVKISDEGKYKCFISSIQKEAFIQLNVGAVSSPVVTTTNSTFRGVTLDCESKGWYPEPEVFWLDGEGNLLSAGPTETVRGPDDLYTVSSRVTVEKRHSNSFTCRVQQKNINQTRETHIHVPDDFFMTLSSSSPSARTIIGSVVGIIFILAVVFVVWKWRRKKIKTKRNQRVNDERGKERNQSKSYNTEVQSLAEGETEQPRTENKSANAESGHMRGKKENQNCTQDTVSSGGRKKLRAANGRRKSNV